MSFFGVQFFTYPYYMVILDHVFVKKTWEDVDSKGFFDHQDDVTEASEALGRGLSGAPVAVVRL